MDVVVRKDAFNPLFTHSYRAALMNTLRRAEEESRIRKVSIFPDMLGVPILLWLRYYKVLLIHARDQNEPPLYKRFFLLNNISNGSNLIHLTLHHVSALRGKNH